MRGNACKITPELSQRFAVMSFVSAILIVALHSLSADKAGCFVRWVCSFMVGGVCQIAIPWFFFAAGFFLAGHIGEDGWWKREVGKRIRTLLVPFWIWSAVIFSVNVLFAVLIRISGYRYGGVDALSWLSWSGFLRVIGLDYFDTMPTMWFLRTLFLFVMLTPVLAWIKRGGLWVLFLLMCCFPLIPDKNVVIAQLGLNLLSTRGLFFFAAGLYWRRYGGSIPVRSDIVAWLGILLCMIRVACAESGYGKMALFLNSFQLPALTYAVYFFCTHLHVAKKWTSLSFPIYVTHMVVVLTISAFYGVIGIGGEGNITLLKGILRFGLGLAVTMGLSVGFRRAFPRISQVAFGGR